MVEKEEVELICPVCKKKLTRCSDYGVTMINGRLCAIVVAHGCDCHKLLTLKFPIDMDKVFI